MNVKDFVGAAVTVLVAENREESGIVSAVLKAGRSVEDSTFLVAVGGTELQVEGENVTQYHVIKEFTMDGKHG